MPSRPYFTRQKDDALETTTDVTPFANAAREVPEGRIRGYVRDVQGENNRFFQEARERRNPEIARLRTASNEKAKTAPAVAKFFNENADALAAEEMKGYAEPDSIMDKRARVRKARLVKARRKLGLSDDGKTLANGQAIPAPSAPAAPAMPAAPKPRRPGEMTREEIEQERARMLGF